MMNILSQTILEAGGRVSHASSEPASRAAAHSMSEQPFRTPRGDSRNHLEIFSRCGQMPTGEQKPHWLRAREPLIPAIWHWLPLEEIQEHGLWTPDIPAGCNFPTFAHGKNSKISGEKNESSNYHWGSKEQESWGNPSHSMGGKAQEPGRWTEQQQGH